MIISTAHVIQSVLFIKHFCQNSNFFVCPCSVCVCVCHVKYPFPASCRRKTCLKIGHVLLLQVSGAIKLVQEMLFTRDIFWHKSLAPENLCQKFASLNVAENIKPVMNTVLILLGLIGLIGLN